MFVSVETGVWMKKFSISQVSGGTICTKFFILLTCIVWNDVCRHIAWWHLGTQGWQTTIWAAQEVHYTTFHPSWLHVKEDVVDDLQGRTVNSQYTDRSLPMEGQLVHWPWMLPGTCDQRDFQAPGTVTFTPWVTFISQTKTRGLSSCS